MLTALSKRPFPGEGRGPVGGRWDDRGASLIGLPNRAPAFAGQPALFLRATRILLAAATLLALAAPAHAEPARSGIATQLDAARRDGYRAVFAAIRAGQYDDAAARLDGMGDGPLHAVARAELFLAKGSPRPDNAALTALVGRAPELPEAPQLVALLKKRGGGAAGDLVLPTLPTPRQLTPVKGAPRRLAARAVRSDAAAARLAVQIRPLVKEDRAGEMEGYLLAAQEELTPEARTEWQQRIAWSYYLAGDDADALRLALAAGAGTGDWATSADWVAGLAAWRQDRCDPAGRAFAGVGRNARDDEMRAAGLFWSARADFACRRPEQVQAKLRAAARIPETFYGLIAARTLGIAPPPAVKRASLAATEWSALAPHSNAQAAVALTEIGEPALADRMIRWQAQIGRPADHLALVHLAGGLDLPATQVWLAHNSPDGNRIDASARYPAPGWTPANGWQVDRSLVFAHSLEESVFRVGATSGAGARGLMGIMPGTAEQLDRREGLPGTDRARLADPAVNMAYGQRMLTWLRDLPSTGGLLPKVIAAYNAGPGANIKWNPLARDRGDPLLWIESIPYIETRAYVGLVLRNYWMYQRQAGERTPSLAALAQGMWPRFPGLAGQTALRVSAPARAPVRLALVMPPVRAPRVPEMPADTPPADTLLADAAPPVKATAPVLVHAGTSLPTPSAAGRAMASATDAGRQSVAVVKDVARTLAGPVVRSQTAAPGTRLDAMLAPILARELPARAKRGNARLGTTAKAVADALKDAMER